MSDPMASRNVFMFNMVTIFLAVFTLHWVSALLKRLEKEKKILTIMYLMACLLSLFFIIFPDFFMLASAPKAYFPNFYVPGKYYFLGDIIFYVTILYTFFRMFQSYKTADFILKKRIRYVFIGLVGALVFSSLPAFLLYGIPVDPLFSFFGGFFYIIMGYGLVKENFLNINLVAKKTFFYTILVGLLGIIIAGADYLNSYLINQNVNFPRWLMPLSTVIIIFLISIIIWKRLREIDVLKYEFINIVTHKFRTPLTYIKWSLDDLKNKQLDQQSKISLKNIETAQFKLSKLTESLIEMSNTENVGVEYQGEKTNLYNFVTLFLDKFKKENLISKVELKCDNNSKNLYVKIDKKRLEFVIQTLVENSEIYSLNAKPVEIIIEQESKWGILKIKDYGIGIETKELSFIFKKFYRSQKATSINTEGMGIGLFISKTIVERFGGKMRVESAGENKGSCFYIYLPLVK